MLRYIRAGGVTTFVISSLAALVVTGFGVWYSSLTSGEIAERLILWFGLAFIAVAPVALILMPLVHLILGFGERPAGRLFAMIGGVLGALVAGYALFRFRGVLFPSTGIAFLAIPAMVIGATLLGILGGFLFERLARRKRSEATILPPVKPASGTPAQSDEGRVSEPGHPDVRPDRKML
ncbi:MAG TPA: hypothetical protein PLQ11_03590 [Beijerinckiaceae bacterium]|nr:hypothetical protein [Beijerinckiaceae bacterium]